jgi:GAF domain-containing protein
LNFVFRNEYFEPLEGGFRGKNTASREFERAAVTIWERLSPPVAAREQAHPYVIPSLNFRGAGGWHLFGSRFLRINLAAWRFRTRHVRESRWGDGGSYQELLSRWARNCPENFACMEALVAAEIARIEGRNLDAELLYEDSLSSAHENGFVHHEGLANEHAAMFYIGRGLRTIAYAYLRNARYCYLRWGALGKVRQIDENYRGSSEERIPSLRDAVIARAGEQLDFATVVKGLQAISSEIVLGKLIETLVRIAVENAGAERGLLLLLRNDEPQIEAEATTISGRVEVVLKTLSVTSSDLPQSTLHYAMRTRESVILEDASHRNLFSDDEYLRLRHPKSVLCMPIVRQAKLTGLLYLENNLTTHAFTPDRIAVLKLLASQAAISLENAYLYADLRQENLDRERAEEALRASEQVSRGQVEALTFSLDVLATASEPQKYLARMLSIICGQLTGQSASLWLFDEPTDSLILRREVDSVNAVGFDREHPLIQNPQSWKESPVIQELFYAAGPIVCEDIETDRRLNDRFREYFMSKGTKKIFSSSDFGRRTGQRNDHRSSRRAGTLSD